MGARLLLGICAVLVASAFANAAEGEAASVVVGLAKCSDCIWKNMKAEAAFKGLQVAIKCKNSNGEYESKAVGELDGSGAFSIPLDADLQAEDCLAQLHSASSTPCPGQEPSKIVPQTTEDGKTTFVAVAGKMHRPSKECASAFLCDPFHKKHFDFHKPIVIPPLHKPPKPEPKPKPKPEPKPEPEYGPPKPKPPVPAYHPKPTPIYHPPVHH